MKKSFLILGCFLSSVVFAALPELGKNIVKNSKNYDVFYYSPDGKPQYFKQIYSEGAFSVSEKNLKSLKTVDSFDSLKIIKLPSTIKNRADWTNYRDNLAKKGVALWPVVTFYGNKNVVSNGEIIFEVKNNISQKQISSIIEKFGLKIIENSTDNPELFLAKLPIGKDPFEVSNAIFKTALVKWAEPNFFINIETAELPQPVNPTDGQFYAPLQNWYLVLMRVKYAWALTTGNPEIKVAIIDTGIEKGHEDLKDNYDESSEWNFINETNNGQPDTYTFLNEISAQIAHGTNVAGVIAAKGNNNKGIAGMCWDCKIMNLKFIHVPTDGSPQIVTTHKVYTAFKHAVNNEAAVINNSWVFNQKSDNVPLMNVVEYAVQYAVKKGRNGKGSIVVWAAGNDEKNVEGVTNFKNDHIVVVSSVRATGDLAKYSNYGDVIDVAAPGGSGPGIDPAPKWGLMTTDLTTFGIDNSAYEIFAGTSAAAPVISGALALMLSANPELTADEAIHCLKKSAVNSLIERESKAELVDCFYQGIEWEERDNDPYIEKSKFNKCYGYGIPDVYEMIRMAVAGECSFELKKCTNNSGCPENQFCDTSTGKCFLAKTCKTDTDCPPEWLCDTDSGTCYGVEKEPEPTDSDSSSTENDAVTSDEDTSTPTNDSSTPTNDSNSSDDSSNTNNDSSVISDNSPSSDNNSEIVSDEEIVPGSDEDAGCGCSLIF